MHHAQMPPVEPGLVELGIDDPRSGALHQFVASVRFSVQGNLYWVDAGNTASTYIINEEFARQHRHGNFHIGRAFTAYQHFSLVRRLIKDASPRTGLAVVPNVASLYSDDDVPEYEDTRLMESTIAVLSKFADTYEVPVIMTAPRADADQRSLIEGYLSDTIDCRETDVGLRFEADEFETTVYWDSGYWQTTIPYWVDLLGVADDDQGVPTPTDLQPRAPSPAVGTGPSPRGV